jgi:ribA/ribD-fused uncharacterized protein
MKTIDQFTGEYRFLSNFWPASVGLDGVEYPSVENAYQAAKTLDAKARRPFAKFTAHEAKKAGRALAMRKDWEEVKLAVMESLLIVKFDIDDLRAKLLATGDAELVEGNWWGDRFWGVCNGVGENHLGRLLMKVRAQLAEVPTQPCYKCGTTLVGRPFVSDVAPKLTSYTFGPCPACFPGAKCVSWSMP